MMIADLCTFILFNRRQAANSLNGLLSNERHFSSLIVIHEGVLYREKGAELDKTSTLVKTPLFCRHDLHKRCCI